MRAFAQSIVETVRYPLVILDQALRVLKANAAFYRTFGLHEGEAEGRALGSLAIMQCLPNLTGLLEGGQLGAALYEGELTGELPTLGTRVMAISARPVTHDDGSRVILLSIEDTTEQAEARELLQRLNEELEGRVRQRTTQLYAANAELEAFCYSVSHDLRAPLRALDGFSDELLRTYPGKVLDERAEHYLRRIRAGSQRMAQLIDDLLRLSRLSRMEIRSEHVDLTLLAQAIFAELRQREPERLVSASVQPALSATEDAGLLRIALENLIGNAWKFSSANQQATLQVGYEDVEGVGAFYVKDDGVGFDMAHAARLFGAFQRLHDERQFPGNGIGLATVQRIVHRHGGRLWANARPGAGAAFHFTLCAPNPGSNDASVSGPAPRRGLHG